MTYSEIISRFQIKQRKASSVQCICPAHNDNEASLTISNGQNGTVLYCHAGCSTENVLAAVGLTMKDLFEDGPGTEAPKKTWISYVESKEGKCVEGAYHYQKISGGYAFTRLRLSGKKFIYGIIADDRFNYGLNGTTRRSVPAFFSKHSVKEIRDAIARGDIIFYCEGEKDVNTLADKGFVAVTCGGTSDWCEGCSELFKGANVVILADNDTPGKKLAEEVERSLIAVAKSTKIIIPVPEVEKADISDYFTDHTVDDFKRLISKTDNSGILSCVQSADEVEEQETEWLFPPLIPRYHITICAGDGGSGKTTIECAMAASVTTGKPCFLTPDIPFEAVPENVLFLSAEDDFSRVLKRKLRIAGADMSRVFTVPISSAEFSKIKFDSDELVQLIKAVRPGLVFFDPIQAFVPPDIQMGWRNAMRQCLNPLIGLGETYGATFVIVCHSNKQSGISGRKRIAESADIWDIARSVLMVGSTGEGDLKYLSHEKSNYGALQHTILYSLDGEKVVFRGYSDLKDADYVRNDRLPRSAPARDEAKELAISTLNDNGGSMKADDFDRVLKGMGVSLGTLKRAKADLKKDGLIKYFKNGFDSAWMISFVQVDSDTVR